MQTCFLLFKTTTVSIECPITTLNPCSVSITSDSVFVYKVPTKISEKKSMEKKKQKSREIYQKKNCPLEGVREKLN